MLRHSIVIVVTAIGLVGLFVVPAGAQETPVPNKGEVCKILLHQAVEISARANKIVNRGDFNSNKGDAVSLFINMAMLKLAIRRELDCPLAPPELDIDLRRGLVE